ncbi:Aste57867_22113 [Aphanomyces stellatus]|uniref:Aste57867_22113 protein n=1 Tax=Aphanomyces stellatus TaxID=120398 RepID=A0A485LK50_9STRA|nr:hypothetical protein As57867_022044 [Aphanomyces stellatus]VFT98781.1 Aste57867_22113 [Aphanomyces stellatus]
MKQTIKNLSLQEYLLSPNIVVDGNDHMSKDNAAPRPTSIGDDGIADRSVDGKHRAWRFDTHGSCSLVQVTRTEILDIVKANSATAPIEGSKIPAIRLGDFRQLESAYSAAEKPTITVREQAILINVDPIRAVVMRDSAYIFDGPSTATAHLKASFWQHARENPSVPFEFAAIEAILSSIAAWYDGQFHVVKPIADDLLNAIANIERPRDEFERLRRIQSTLGDMRVQVSGIRDLLMGAVDNDDELHMMYLTKLHQQPHLACDLFAFDVDEVVSLLEVYLQKIYTTLSKISLLVKKTENTESSLNLKWTSRRNQLLLVDIPLKIFYLGVWAAAFQTAVMAINMDSRIQMIDGLFWPDVALLLAFIAWFYWFVCRHLKSQGVTVTFAAPTPAAPVVDLLASEILHVRPTDGLAEDAVGKKRRAIRFDARGHATEVDLSRVDLFKTIEAAASGVLAIPEEVFDLVPLLSIGTPLGDYVPPPPRPAPVMFREAPVEIPAVHMRDIRMLDHALSSSNDATIMVRQQAILAICDPIRAVILRDACIVFLPDGATTLTADLKASFLEQIHDATHDVGFELTALEAILASVSRALAQECHKIAEIGRAQLNMMAQDETNLSVLENLRSVKNAMSDVESEVNGLQHMLMSLLDNELDLHMMHLTKLANDPTLMHDLFSFDTDDAESFLEAYLQDMYTTRSDVTLLIHNVQNTESIVMMKLDTKRNYLLSIDLIMSLLMTLIAIPNFVCNSFTMNLVSHVERSFTGFWVTFSSAFVFVYVGYVYLIGYLRREGFNMSWYY